MSDEIKALERERARTQREMDAAFREKERRRKQSRKKAAIWKRRHNTKPDLNGKRW